MIDGGYNTIQNNTIRNTQFVGIQIRSPFCVVSGNMLWNNGGDGIFSSLLENSTVIDNIIYDGGASGMQIVSSDFSTISRNYIAKNAGIGILLGSAFNDNTVSLNVIEKNQFDGILVLGNDVQGLRNKSNRNGDVGIRINGNNNSIIGNRALNNDTLDLMDNGTGNNFTDNVFETSNFTP